MTSPRLFPLARIAALFSALSVGLIACDDEAAPQPQDDAETDARVRDMTMRDMLVPVDMAPPDAAPDAMPDMRPPEPDMAPDAVPDMMPIDAAPPDMMPDMMPPCDPSPETCNGRDDDCDENIDEGLHVGDVCSAGVGGCRMVARVECRPDGTSGCPAVAGAAVPEVCDAVDNDCDGRIDEEFDGDGDGAPDCGFDGCGDDCPLGDAALCRAVCDAHDCNDLNIGASPTLEDVCGDGIDQNCDGVDASCSVATGRLTRLEIAGNMNQGVCPDNNGDGNPDNALSLVGGIANDGLGNAITNAQLNLFLIAAGLAPPGDQGLFDLSVVTASRNPDRTFQLDDAALDENGRPLIRFNRSRVRDGEMRTPPSVFSLNVPIAAGLDLTLSFSNAEIRGLVAVDDNDGFSLAEGVLWGAITQDDLNAALDGLEANCAAAEMPPAFCGPLAMLRPILPNLLHLDQDLDGDGVSESYSACLLIAASPEVLAGWPPE
ncbi:MAG: hypothetical protein KC620_19380 [Myxococcales bacterium]|nr:hypothetical protein [Myxococcales bacterium]